MTDAHPLAPGGARVDPLHALCATDPLWNERYEGWQVLGQGASATVVRARSRALDEDVALKIFQRLDEDGLRRFQQEVRHNQRLASPYVVRTYSPFLRVGLSWIEMEWVDGLDLRQTLRQRAGQPYALGEACALGAALAHALAIAHGGGVVHRDVKPANVLLPRNGRPPAKLGDFGISRVADAARVTATGLIAGTPQFVAPEVIAGQPADARSDIYSLALVLFLVMSGERFPFDVAAEDPPARWLHAHGHAQPRRLRSLAPTVPEALDELLARALAKQPETRPTALEIATLLGQYAVSAPGQASASKPVAEPALAAASPPASVVLTVTSAATLASPAPEPLGATASLAAGSAMERMRWRWRPWVLTAITLALGAWWWLHARQPETARTPPAASPPASVPQAVAPAWHLSVAREGPVLVLVHEGGPSVPPCVLLAFDANGTRHAAALESTLESGQQVGLALDSLVPPFPPEGRLVRVELNGPSFGAPIVVTASAR